MATIKTWAQRVTDDYNDGKITLNEAARELCRAGFTNFVDEATTLRVIDMHTRMPVKGATL